MAGYILVEGHGEIYAAPNLINRLWIDLELPYMHWKKAVRWPNIQNPERMIKGCHLLASNRDAEALLVIRDDEDGCPKMTGPALARRIQDESLPVPVAVTLFYREYETLFLAAMDDLKDRPFTNADGSTVVLLPGATFEGDPQSVRDAKGAIRQRMPGSTKYRETIHQLGFTRMLNFDTLRASKLPCFQTLERALKHLGQHIGQAGEVYPSPVPRGDQ